MYIYLYVGIIFLYTILYSFHRDFSKVIYLYIFVETICKTYETNLWKPQVTGKHFL